MDIVLDPDLGLGRDGWRFGFGVKLEGGDWFLVVISPCCKEEVIWKNTTQCSKCSTPMLQGYSDPCISLYKYSEPGQNWVNAWLGWGSNYKLQELVKIEVKWT